MTKDEIMASLQQMGSAQTKKTFLRHGAVEPLFGVKVQDLKTIVKKVKKNHPLSLELFDTGNSDAMYLAGLIADEKLITKEDLGHWAKLASWYMISEYTVAWIAAESPFGIELGLEWINAAEINVRTAGWATLSNTIAIKPDAELDLRLLGELMIRVKDTITQVPNRVKYVMNGFLIAVGCYIESLSDTAIKVAAEISPVKIDMGDTACKVPDASVYINKVIEAGRLGKKKKEVRC